MRGDDGGAGAGRGGQTRINHKTTHRGSGTTHNLHEAETIQNGTETYQLEHLGSLGPKIV